MVCSNCGKKIRAKDKFCKDCGTPQHSDSDSPRPTPPRKREIDDDWDDDLAPSRSKSPESESFGNDMGEEDDDDDDEKAGHGFSIFLLIISATLLFFQAWGSAFVVLILVLICSPISHRNLFKPLGLSPGLAFQSFCLVIGTVVLLAVLYHEVPKTTRQKSSSSKAAGPVGSAERLTLLIELEKLMNKDQVDEVLLKIESYYNDYPTPDAHIDKITSDALIGTEEDAETARIARLHLLVPELIAHGRQEEAWQLAKEVDDPTLHEIVESARQKSIPTEQVKLLDSLVSIPVNDYKSRANVYKQLLKLRPENEVYRTKHSFYRNNYLAQREYEKADHARKIGNLTLSNKHLNTLLDKYPNSPLKRKAENLLASNKDVAKLRPKKKVIGQPKKSKHSISGLKIVKWTWSVQYGHARVMGTVKNVSLSTIRNVSAVASFFNRRGDRIASGRSLLEIDPLGPGQVSGFRVFVRSQPTMTKASVDFVHNRRTEKKRRR